MPETAAGRALQASAMSGQWRRRGAEIDAIEAEARALGRAEALAAVRAAVEELRRSKGPKAWITLDTLLAALDNLETP